MRYLKHLQRTAALLCLAVTPAVLADDPREVWDGITPPWLASVGKLTVPGVRIERGYRRHHIEDCSATLVKASGDASADLVVTAWHCLAYYRDLSKTILFTLGAPHGTPLERTARRLADGGGMHDDWAILRLNQPVPAAMAIAITDAGDIGSGDRLVMAGYSGDPGLGDSGRHLTYHADCRPIDANGSIVQTDCLAFKGASGGAVLRTSTAGTAELVGVVSEGDGETTSTYVPLARLRTPLDRFLGAKNSRPLR